MSERGKSTPRGATNVDLIEREEPEIKHTMFPRYPEAPAGASAMEKLKLFLAWVTSTRPVRLFKHFGQQNGSLLAGGMAYSAIFSLFAGIWAIFSAMALLIADDQGLKDLILGGMSDAVPGLVGEDGVIKPSTLDQAGGKTFGIMGIIALIGTFWTALGWLAGARAAIRKIFEVPVSPPTNFALLKLKDLGVIIGFGLMMIASTFLTVASTAALKWLLSILGIGEDAPILTFVLRVLAICTVIAADAVIMALLVRVLTGLRIPKRTLMTGALIGAVGVQILKQLGSALLGGATSNPIAASFAVLLGVLIFFNLLCTVLLLTSSWIKITMDDLGTSPRKLTAEEANQEAEEAEIEARRERLAADRIRLREELQTAPRFGRSKLRREYERVIEEERKLHEEDTRRRLGLNKAGEPEAEGVNDDDAPNEPSTAAEGREEPQHR